MTRKLQLKRLLALALALVGVFGVLGYRLVDLQVLRHDELSQRAQNETLHTYHLEPRRGDILDIRGNLLATSVFVKTVCADPTLLSNHVGEVAHVIAPLLQTNEAELAQHLLPRYHRNEKGALVPSQYVVLKQKVSLDTWDKIQSTMSNLTFGVNEKKLPRKQLAALNALREKGIFADPTEAQLRTYPNLNLAAHVLGYTAVVDATNEGVRFRETVGMDGIERSLEDKLKGARGWRVSERDRQDREMVVFRQESVEPRDGLNAVLTIDSSIQHILEAALADAMQKHTPISISGMVIRPRTGEILAMATLPNYDPNFPGQVADESARRNRCIADVEDPGSTFKIVVVSGALNDKVVTLDDQFDCGNGVLHYAGSTLHDHEHYGILSVKGIITHSSNIGAAQIAIQRLGDQRLYYYMSDFGFGSCTGIALPGEVRGLMNPLSKWWKVSLAQIPMGQGVSVTSLQMAMAMCTVANGGVLMRPLIIDHLEAADGTTVVKYTPQAVRRVISEETDREMIEALKTVPTREGTAPEAALEHYTVAGKTGTAQKTDKGHYSTDKFFSSFIGFFPADNPEVLIYVAMDEPKDGHYGGRVAAPVFKQIAEKAANVLNIRPDRDTNAPPAGVAASPDLAAKPVAVRVP